MKVLRIKKKIVSLALLACLAVAPAYAAEWYWLGSDSYNSRFVDTASLEKNDYQAIVWWKNTGPKGDSYLKKLAFNRYDRTVAVAASYLLDKYGDYKKTYSNKPRSEWKYEAIVPESFMEEIYNWLWPAAAGTANRWYYLGKWSDGATFFVDNLSVRKDAQTARVWTKENDPNGHYSIQYRIIRRNEKTLTIWKSYTLRGSAGHEYIDTEALPNEVIPILPGSMDEKLFYAIWPN